MRCSPTQSFCVRTALALTLPVATAVASHGGPMLSFDESRPASVVDRQHAHLVILDPNERSRGLTQHLLGKLGCDHVWAVADVTALHDALLVRRCDLLLTTWGLPGLSGNALLWLVRHLPSHEHLPVLITEVVTSALVREAAEAGVNGFVPRPLSPDSLEDLLHIFLGPRAQATTTTIALASN